MGSGKSLLTVAVALMCVSCGLVDVAVGAAAVASDTTIATTTAAAITTTAKATNTTTAPTAAGTTTEPFIPVPPSECKIPFWHGNCWRHTCVKYNDFGDYWCSLTSNFTKDEVWKRCKSPDLKRFQCHIPFEFEGKNHTECLPIAGAAGHNSFWCAVVPKIVTWSAEGTDWAYCEHKEATGVTYLKTVGVNWGLPHNHTTTNHTIAATTTTKPDVTAAAAAAAAAAGAAAPAKSLHGVAGDSHGAGGAAAGLGAQATVGISVGVVCSVLAVVAVIAGVAIRKRRRGGDHKALLQTREKGTYGGVEASD